SQGPPTMTCRLLLLPLLFALIWVGRVAASDEGTGLARAFIKGHERRIRPLDVAAGLAWWKANTTGDDAAFKAKVEAQNKIDAALADKKVFAELKKLHDKKADIDDAVTRRTIEVLYLLYLEKQVDVALLKKMAELSNSIEKKFNNFRAKLNDKELTDNEVRKILMTSNDSNRLQVVWAASKAVGKEVEADLKQLVKYRNQAAKKLGFKNFQVMQLKLNEQDPDQ